MTYELIAEYLPNLIVIVTIFTVGVASPGPATLMILGTAMSRGRASAIALSFGVMTGSIFWASVAALGFVAAIQTSASLFMAMKIAGGVYLFYLAVRSWRSALISQDPASPKAGAAISMRAFFLRGLLLHLTNPKAPLVWLATLSVGLGDDVPGPFLVTAIGLCALIAMIVFIGYAMLFSTAGASRFYLACRRPLEAFLGCLFGAAAVSMLTHRIN